MAESRSSLQFLLPALLFAVEPLAAQVGGGHDSPPEEKDFKIGPIEAVTWLGTTVKQP
ncbi:MAG: hypothetical protein WD342_01470 [Verrucomicrobiales bacterium]